MNFGCVVYNPHSSFSFCMHVCVNEYGCEDAKWMLLIVILVVVVFGSMGITGNENRSNNCVDVDTLWLN